MRTRVNNEPSADQILNICKLNVTPNEKERLLLQIGLQWYEARGLARVAQNDTICEIVADNVVETHQAVAQYAQPIIIEQNELAAYTIGVEIECFATRSSIINASQAHSVECYSESYNHNDRGRGFKLVTDASVVGLPDSVECVSNILHYNDSKAVLNNFCEALADANARINKTCGLHVHVASETMTDEQYCNTFVNYMYLSDLIETALADSRHNSRWAQPLKRYESRVLNATSKNAMRVALYNDRYFQVNPMAYERHRTIEFRQHQGTTEAEKINNWVAFCVKLVNFSKSNRYTAENVPTTFDGLTFLNESEKAYFKARAQHFAERRARLVA